MMGVRSNVSNEEDLMNKELRFVLLVKIRNSSVIFSYPVLMNTGDGSL